MSTAAAASHFSNFTYFCFSSHNQRTLMSKQLQIHWKKVNLLRYSRISREPFYQCQSNAAREVLSVSYARKQELTTIP
jgi:hypothetical protein